MIGHGTGQSTWIIFSCLFSAQLSGVSQLRVVKPQTSLFRQYVRDVSAAPDVGREHGRVIFPTRYISQAVIRYGV